MKNDSDKSGTRVWQRREEIARNIYNNAPPGPTPDCNRGSWYCPTVDKEDADQLHELLQREGITTIYDLGTGEGTFAAYMDRLGYDVVAFESIDYVIEMGERQLPLSGVDVRCEDYYAAFDELVSGERAAYCAWGRTNGLPGVPSKGVAVDGHAFEQADIYVDGTKRSVMPA